MAAMVVVRWRPVWRRTSVCRCVRSRTLCSFLALTPAQQIPAQQILGALNQGFLDAAVPDLQEQITNLGGAHEDRELPEVGSVTYACCICGAPNMYIASITYYQLERTKDADVDGTGEYRAGTLDRLVPHSALQWGLGAGGECIVAAETEGG